MKTSNPGAHTSALHMFSSGRKKTDVWSGAVQREWKALPVEEQAMYHAMAENTRAVAIARDTPLETYVEAVSRPEAEEGPLQISSRSGKFDVHPAVIERTMQDTTMQKLFNEWTQRFPNKVMPHPTFPETVQFDGPILHSIPLPHEHSVSEMLETLRLSLRFCDEGTDCGLLVEMVFEEQKIFCFVGHSLYLERGSFEAEMIRMRPVSHVSHFPFLLRYEISTVTDEPWPAVQCETSLISAAVQLSAGRMWELSELKNVPAGLACREVSQRRPIDIEHLRALDKDRLLQAAAMKVFRQSQGLTQSGKKGRGGPSGGRGKGRGSGGRGGAASSSADPTGSGAAPKPKPKKTLVMEDDTSDASDETSDGPIAKPSHDKKVASGHVAPGKATPHVNPAKANERVVEWWDGRFPFARIFGPANAVGTRKVIGWGVTCSLHTNEDGRCAGTPCKKSVTIGKGDELTEEEACKRLKRWLIVGKIDPLDASCQRQSHVSKGGVQLRDFATGVAGWEELDPDLDTLLHTC